ncbi:MAG: fumarylacetoacetate hydrolase family protein, partial [Rhodospirillales bacterium]|nr:fumarylacetoacetate hydrolase family protein [Rhodospirillales bacterium]
MAALLNAGSKVLVFGGHAAVHAHSSNMPDGPLTAYFKFPAAFADPGVDIVLPGKGRVFDADCALGVVIGKPGGRMALT